MNREKESTVSFLKIIMKQSGLFVLISLMIAVGVNAVRSDGIPLPGDWSAETRITEEGGNLAISLDEAKSLLDADSVLFLDARPAHEFEAGHIQGARNLPWQSFDAYFEEVMAETPEAVTIVTYCDGEACTLSTDLAKALVDFGFPDVRVLANGWSRWKNSGFPVDSAADTNG